jgi:prevent-host-death family protein
MEITTEQLKIQPEIIISEVNNGQEITITWQGKPSARIVPIVDTSDSELFGIWKNRDDTGDVEQYVRNVRKRQKE